MRRDDGRIDKQVEFRLHTELLSFIKPARLLVAFPC